MPDFPKVTTGSSAVWGSGEGGKIQKKQDEKTVKVGRETLSQPQPMMHKPITESKLFISNPDIGGNRFFGKLCNFLKYKMGMVSEAQYEMQTRMWGLRGAAELQGKERKKEILENLQAAKKYMLSEGFQKLSPEVQANYVSKIFSALPNFSAMRGDDELRPLVAFLQLHQFAGIFNQHDLANSKQLAHAKTNSQKVCSCLVAMGIFSKNIPKEELEVIQNKVNTMESVGKIHVDFEGIKKMAAEFTKNLQNPQKP
jgi:hypothetical protein